MAETSTLGATVPSVKSEAMPLPSEQDGPPPDQPLEPPSEPLMEERGTAQNGGANGRIELDKDFLCPICMQIIKDAFLTACGHSFCYMCIITHLRSKSNCPCCRRLLTMNHIFPNFALNQALKKMSDHQLAKIASPFERLRQALHQGCEVSVKELDALLSLLADKKKRMEQEEAETNLQILLEFLHCLKKKKLEELQEIQYDLLFIEDDIGAVHRHKMDLYKGNKRYPVRLRMIDDDLAKRNRSPSSDQHTGADVSRQDQWASSHSQNLEGDTHAPVCPQELVYNNVLSSSELCHLALSEKVLTRKRQIKAQFNELRECYLQKRRHWARASQGHEDGNITGITRVGYHDGLEEFKTVLKSFTRYSRLRVIAELRHGNIFHSANIVSSIEFDRDNELFATAGVSRRIKVFDFSSVVDEPAEVHFPVVDIATRSKLSCLSWNKHTKNHIASSDYEGMITVWDVSARQSVREYEEHEKRAWTVDFSRAEPSMLISGGDDCKVNVWCINQETSVLNINMKANICSVKCNPGSSIHVAVGSADHNVHYYDLRNISRPVYVFKGHRKAVSYVQFMSNNELASASTDSTLQLWDLRENLPLRTYRGHTNEKNFVGLTANSQYLACGSEANEVFVYHKAICKPAAKYKFSSSEMETEEERGSYFISSVCWRSDSPTLMAANSHGSIKVLALAD